MILHGSDVRPNDPSDFLSIVVKKKRWHCIHVVPSGDTPHTIHIHRKKFDLGIFLTQPRKLWADGPARGAPVCIELDNTRHIVDNTLELCSPRRKTWDWAISLVIGDISLRNNFDHVPMWHISWLLEQQVVYASVDFIPEDSANEGGKLV